MKPVPNDALKTWTKCNELLPRVSFGKISVTQTPKQKTPCPHVKDEKRKKKKQPPFFQSSMTQGAVAELPGLIGGAGVCCGVVLALFDLLRRFRMISWTAAASADFRWFTESSWLSLLTRCKNWPAC